MFSVTVFQMVSVNLFNAPIIILEYVDFSLQLTCFERYHLPPILREQNLTPRKTSQR